MSFQRCSEFQAYDPFHSVKSRTPMHLENTSHKLDKYFQGENFMKKIQNLKCRKILLLKYNSNPKQVIFPLRKSSKFLVTSKDILMIRNPENVVWNLSVDLQIKCFGNDKFKNTPHNRKKKVHLLKL